MESRNCCTKYPVLMIHGVGFRDLRWPLYWGRIPAVIASTGTVLFYGQQDCWARIEDNARSIKARIRQILDETDAEKVNIIAHSKGGLEARMAASSLGMGNSIASITTIGTPHRGSKTIDKLLKAPDSLFNIASFAVDNWIGLIGDTKLDFYAVCKDFSTEYAERFNRENPDVPGVYYQSYAGVMKTPLSDINLSTANVIVRLIEGDNDGLVSVESAKWGDSFTLLTGRTNRGVSHYDEIDFRRAPLTSKKYGDGVADICDVYLSIINGLVKCGF
ncbi:MAG: triacylglycerol lipase [Oscillospiraceae bacterium]|nr:triacylglycerol lipase [Oscillospiraceae bacterium]